MPIIAMLTCGLLKYPDAPVNLQDFYVRFYDAFALAALLQQIADEMTQLQSCVFTGEKL